MNNYKSDEERYFADWLEELKEADYVKSWEYEPETFVLAEKVDFPCLKRMKTKNKQEEFNGMQKVEYTYDFKILWDFKAVGIFIWDESITYIKKSDVLFFNYGSTVISYIDIKGTFGGRNNSSAISAPIKMKWLYQKYGIYVQIIKPLGGLFKKTFYPKSYFTTDKGNERSKRIKGKNIPISELKEFKTIEQWKLQKNNCQ